LDRALWLGFRRVQGSGLRPSIPIAVLAVMTVVLIAGRITLNVVDSNVIDVGYSGVIGADRIADREPIYDNFPSDDQSGDTYGPVAYYAYVPLEQALPWSGTCANRDASSFARAARTRSGSILPTGKSPACRGTAKSRKAQYAASASSSKSGNLETAKCLFSLFSCRIGPRSSVRCNARFAQASRKFCASVFIVR
jgi:hypothetical protein